MMVENLLFCVLPLEKEPVYYYTHAYMVINMN